MSSRLEVIWKTIRILFKVLSSKMTAISIQYVCDNHSGTYAMCDPRKAFHMIDMMICSTRDICSKSQNTIVDETKIKTDMLALASYLDGARNQSKSILEDAFVKIEQDES